MTNLPQLIDFIKKTGDKCVILDEFGNPFGVLMTLGDYEKLFFGKLEVIGLTEEELLAKINRDIAVWKENQKVQDLVIDQYEFSKDLGEYSNYNGSLENDYINNSSNFLENNSESRFNKEKDEKDEKEEDQYYFEPVE